MVFAFPNNENGQLGADGCQYDNIYITTGSLHLIVIYINNGI
jgi:hypothetical protein